MKIIIENTEKIVKLTSNDGGTLPARIWEGQTESGIPVICYITRIAVANDDKTDHDEFRRELEEQRPPSPEVQAIPLRLIL